MLAKETDSDLESFCPQQLPEKIDPILENSADGSRWGIIIQSSVSETILYQKNADQFFIPASNIKLFTTAAALNQFSPQFEIITPIFAEGSPPHLQTLQIIGKGDPSLNRNDLEKLAETLSQTGIRSIATLVLETGYFDTPAINSTWEWEDVYAAYGTAVNSLILDENAVTLTLRPQKVGEVVKIDWDNPIAASQWTLKGEAVTAPANTDYQVELNRKFGTSELNLRGTLPQDIKTDVWQLAIPNPDYYFRDVLLTQLGENGIKVDQVQFLDSDLSLVSGARVSELVSPSLSELITEINRNSNNLYAEAVLKSLIAESGEKAIEKELTALGVSPNHYSLADGSGLSRRNLATPRAIAQLLQGMLTSKNFEIFKSSLAVAGINGTLKNRFQETPLQGNLQGKTGTLTGISTLSGYVNPPHYETLIFSVLLNHSQRYSSEQRAIIDEMILLLSRLKECS
ncbi:D-alanyl-D-alaninecarboxypeptidase/D-alanyl-D-al anine-endopeptidase [Halothece sp. PCC 7418]|uniref:D-alanyl-D-alanine carboxypeptidase/D-alanyl-D-alanine endopeptidase n=1 Tax=Halothece sp. (strain PCC 7418) TaxID=65093 RepID=UPI0002A08C18|nr:D-alanyl-D-alanine carboxypeptidase/D-alanyl-D-alanine-endopeptidase [Halothece sp. PCC 7418]AFZ43791.1 D-alanyl-D-alaninecarboxypeptidase/D-alanyl-D-al anine-endopeptidase [Halothece sp. PCC 7418]